MNKYSELKRLAENATPGPWTMAYVDRDRTGIKSALCKDDSCPDIYGWAEGGPQEPTNDESYIAAANPQAILELLAELENYKQVCKEMAELITAIASIDHDEHENYAYWMGVPHADCANTLSTDTKLAREVLAKHQERFGND